jgi:hypothetical protein
MGPVLVNGWVQDEGPLIVENTRIQDWSGLWTGFVDPWWPAALKGGLYRPVAHSILTATWGVGGGAVWVFKLANILCYLVAVTGVWVLARRLLPPASAWMVAALFAVHPVHAEAVAVAVNQGESLVVGVVGLALAWWVDRSGRPGHAWATIVGMAALYLVALGLKEHALVLPLLLLLLQEIRRRMKSDSSAPRQTAQAVGALAVVGLIFWGIRGWVLGDMTGAPAAFGLPEQLGARSLTMLGVVPEWARLLFWPAHLQADYAPLEVVPWAGWTMAQTAGVATLAAWGGALWWSLRRRPVVAFGLLWIPVALAPVSNTLVPTGVILAERTLMLASVGVIFVVVGLLPPDWWQLPKWRTPVGLGFTVLLVLGVGRSASRMPDWRDPDAYRAALGRDAPASVTTLLALGLRDMEEGRRVDGEARLRAVIAIAPGGSRAYRVLGRYYRVDGLCGPAIPMLLRTIELEPVDQYSRLGLVACLLDRGRYAEARQHASEGVGRPGFEVRPSFLAAVAAADSAVRVGAPPGSVRLPPIEGGHTMIGTLGRAP